MFGVARNTWGIKTSVSSDALIPLYPTHGYAENTNKFKNYSRTQGGKFNVFRTVGTFYEFSLPLDYVSSSDANTINTWWGDQTQLNLVINTGVAGNEINSYVKIENVLKPFGQNVRGKYSNFMGSLLLTTYNGEKPTINSFILNNSYWGILDANKLG